MSSEDPKRPRAEGAPDPGFARGRIQWSRPPQPVFRVGPLPRAENSPFVTAPRPGAGILSGSMAPPPRTEEPKAARQPYVAPTYEPAVESAEETVEAFTDPKLEPIEIVPEVEEPAPARATPAHDEVVAEPAAPEAEPEPAPRSVPSVVVTPAIYATFNAAIETVTKKDRWIVVVAVLAVLITGGFIWLATLPSGGGEPLDLDAPPPAASGLTVEVVEPTVSTEPVGDVAPDPVTPIENRTPVRAEAAPAPTAPAREAAAPVVAPTPPPTTQPRPYIETAPLVVEPPTAARPAPTDPDAPISTGPQPLN